MVGTATEGGRVVAEGVAVGGVAAEARDSGSRDCKVGVHSQIPKIVEDAACRMLEKGEDNNNKREQEQEHKDR